LICSSFGLGLRVINRTEIFRLKTLFIKHGIQRLMAVLIVVFSICQSGAESFGINYLGNMTAGVTGTAGVVPISGWTNIDNATYVNGTIRSSDGSTVATLTLSGAASRGWNSGTANDGGNGSLMNGYMDLGANNNVGSKTAATSVISGLAGSQYDVFLYLQADTARPGNNSDYLPNYNINGVRYYTAVLGGNNFTGFIRADTALTNNNLYPPSLTYGNYIEIDGVMPMNGAITITGEADAQSWRSPLNGIEIVASTKLPRITRQPAAFRLYTGKSVQFSVSATSADAMAYQWRKNGVNLNDAGSVTGANTNYLVMTNLSLSDTGNYDVVITNSSGSVTSSVAHLAVVLETRADTALDAYNAAFLTNSSGLTYYRRSLTNSTDDGTWTLALDILGLEDAYERTGSPQHKQLINDLCASFLVINPPVWSWDGWNDDIGWMTMALIRGYQITGTPAFLAGAENGYNFAFGRGWDTNYDDGGIWEQQPANETSPNGPGKNPLANDSLGKVACMLYQSTGNTNYLNQAQQIYAWVRSHIYNPTTGQINGSISTNGVVDTGSAVYNQGTFIDYANLLHQITGDPMYYNDAIMAAEFTKNHLTSNNNGNGILNNSAGYLNTWADEFARGLGHFIKDNPQLWGQYYPWMKANADSAWANRRTDLNLTWNGWAEPTPLDPGMIPTKAVSAVAMYQFTLDLQPGLVTNLNRLTGNIIGTPGSWNNGGNTIAKVFDNNLSTYFDAPTGATGTWVGLDFGGGVSNVIAQINYWARPGYENRLVGGVFQGDNNPAFSHPVNLCSVITVPPAGGVVTSQSITDQTPFRCVRFLAPANNPACNVAELEFLAPDPPPAPVQITNIWDGVHLILSWPAGGMLLEANNLSGPWITNLTANSPFTAAPGGPQKFYRIIH
jgi:hypothetical protein